MMNILELLNTEHGVFLAQLSIIENLLNQNTSLETLKAATQVLISAVENHRNVEEEILYQRIQEFAPEPIYVMQMEHTQIEKLVNRIINSQEEGNCKSAIKEMIETLRQHIAKEIRVLFPLAESKTSHQELEEMARKCVETYHEKIGLNVKESSRK